MSETAITKTDGPAKREIQRVTDTSEFANLLDTAKFEHLYRVANLFSESTMIPEHYRKQPGNCFIAIQMAVRMQVDPFMFMQRSYVVHGKPGIEAQLAIALINTSGLFENSLDYEIHCDDADGNPHDPSYRVRAFAVRKATGKTVLGPWVDWSLVDGEGWAKKEGSKWKTMPGIMFQYRAATFFGRLHCPERLAGMNTADELDDIKMVDVTATVAENAEPAKRMSLRGRNAPNQNTPAQTPPVPAQQVDAKASTGDQQTGAERGNTDPTPATGPDDRQPAPTNPAPQTGRGPGVPSNPVGGKPTTPPAGKGRAGPKAQHCPDCGWLMAGGKCPNTANHGQAAADGQPGNGGSGTSTVMTSAPPAAPDFAGMRQALKGATVSTIAATKLAAIEAREHAKIELIDDATDEQVADAYAMFVELKASVKK